MEQYCIPEPFIFNSLKHHLGYIRHFISDPAIDKRSTSELNLDLKVIGHSRIDLYTGELEPETIAEHFLRLLMKQGISSRSAFKDWISQSDKKYQILSLKDGSRWTFRLGKKSNRHVHLHPARYSPHVSSVKALPLKTAIAVLIRNRIGAPDQLNLEIVNRTRVEVLQVSPLKSLKRDAGLNSIIGQILARKEHS